MIQRTILSLFLIPVIGQCASATILYSNALTAPPLTAGDLVGQDGWATHSGTGSAVQAGTSGVTLIHGNGSRQDVNRNIGAIGVGQTYYFGFDVIVSGGSDEDYFAHFKNSGNTFTTRVWVSPATGGGDFTFGVSAASSSSPTATWASDFSFNASNRLVGSYTQGTNEVKLWVNPTQESDTSLSVAGAVVAVEQFAFRQGGDGDSTHVVSNLRVATTFAEALAIPEPSPFLFFGLLASGMVLSRYARKARS